MFLLTGCTSQPREAPLPTRAEPEEIVETALIYMAQPSFSSTDFAQQLTGLPVEHELLDMDEKYVYFTIDKAHYHGGHTLVELTTRPEKVEFASGVPTRQLLGDLIYRDKDRIFFRFPMYDLKVNPGRLIGAEYESAVYTVSLTELNQFRTNASIYGGDLEIMEENGSFFYNQGA